MDNVKLEELDTEGKTEWNEGIIRRLFTEILKLKVKEDIKRIPLTKNKHNKEDS